MPSAEVHRVRNEVREIGARMGHLLREVGGDILEQLGPERSMKLQSGSR